MKIRPVEAEVFIADRPRDRHDEGNSRFSQFSERAQNFNILPTEFINLFCTYIRTKYEFLLIQH